MMDVVETHANERLDSVQPVIDAAAFRDALDTIGPRVYRYICSRVGQQAADDVFAETFEVAWRARAKFVKPQENGLEAWLLAIATRVIAAHRRVEMRWLRMSRDAAAHRADRSAIGPPEDEILERLQSNSSRIGEALAALPNRERDVLLLHTLGDLSYAEIATALQIPIGTVRSRINRGRARLAKALSREGYPW
ncbi:MAG: RNA polymerase sigma factor [Thermoleophilia bacterium]|nr:RNA polymerase sigma factor [Thermoleophilia bacterium]